MEWGLELQRLRKAVENKLKWIEAEDRPQSVI